jgi:hypothetical protein
MKSVKGIRGYLYTGLAERKWAFNLFGGYAEFRNMRG